MSRWHYDVSAVMLTLRCHANATTSALSRWHYDVIAVTLTLRHQRCHADRVMSRSFSRYQLDVQWRHGLYTRSRQCNGNWQLSSLCTCDPALTTPGRRASVTHQPDHTARRHRQISLPQQYHGRRQEAELPIL